MEKFYYTDGKNLFCYNSALPEEQTKYTRITQEEYERIKNSRVKRVNQSVQEKRRRIQKLKLDLTKSDYQAIKFAEGSLSETEFAPIRTQRQAWRDEINRLEEQLNESTTQN